MTIPVRYLSIHPEQPGRPFWDQSVLARPFRWLDAEEGDGLDGVDPDGPLVVVVPGRMNYEREPELAALLAPYTRLVLVATGDEEGRFDAIAAAPNAAGWWRQTPPGDPSPAKVLPLGPAPLDWNGRCLPVEARDLRWCFAGQITHARRHEAANVLLQSVPGGLLVASDRFAAGLPRDHYAQLLGRAKVVPCPSGPVHPETFRVWEAIEAGCVPLVDRYTSDGRIWDGLWESLGIPSNLRVDDWRGLPTLVDAAAGDGWQTTANRLQASWAQRQHGLAVDMADRLGLDQPEVTTIVTMSPIPSHPSLAILEATLASILERGPDGPIVVACDAPIDGPDPAYEEAVRRLCDLALHEPGWERVLPLLAPRWLHQANLVRLALDELVATPLVFMVEHDTPLWGDQPIPWAQLSAAVRSGDVNVVRMHHEASILAEHRHLMIGDGPLDVCGVPLWPTVQWSQRPQLASAAYYRRILAQHFPPESRGFIEDHIYSPVSCGPWTEHRVAVYHPVGDIKRSGHLDGRAGGPKAPAYLAP